MSSELCGRDTSKEPGEDWLLIFCIRNTLSAPRVSEAMVGLGPMQVNRSAWLPTPCWLPLYLFATTWTILEIIELSI